MRLGYYKNNQNGRKNHYLVVRLAVMKKLLSYCLLLSFTFAVGQSKIDSLERSLTTQKNDSLKALTYEIIGMEYARRDINKALDYFTKAEELSKKSGVTYRLAYAKYRKGTAYINMNQFDKAEAELNAAFSIFSDLKDNEGMTSVKIALANLSKEQFQSEDAISRYLEALLLVKKIGDKNGEAKIHNSIGTIYKYQKHYEKAIEHYEISLKLVRELNFKPGISACLTNLASAFAEIKNYDKAIPLHEESLKIKKETGDKLGESRVLNNLAVIYNKKKKHDRAAILYTEALKLAKEVNNLDQIIMVELGLAESAFYSGDYKKSIEMGNNVLSSINSEKNREIAIKAHNLLSSAYREQKDYRNALDHAMLKQKFSDSLYSEKIVAVTNDLEAKYESEQKAKEIALLETDNDLKALKITQRSNERNVLIAFAFILLLLGFLLYNQYRIKQKANKELKELDRLKSNFFANISHEFRTPLTLIQGPIEQLEQNPDEKLSFENIKMIRRNTNRVLNLINQLLDLSKIDGGNLHLEPTEIDIYKCLRTATSSFNSLAAQRHIDYRVQIPQTVLWASFDRDKLEKIIYNLLSNAFKFSDDHSTITVDVQYGEIGLQIQVSDSGKGIPADKLPFIFDRFYQADGGSTKEHEGSGIGLSLSKELVELMDGTITVASEPNKGSFFTVVLPVQEIKIRTFKPDYHEEKFKKNLMKKEPFTIPKADNRNLPTILLVEDNNDMRHFIKEQLINSFKVVEAINGEIALQKALENPPDLIITDLMMPRMDGIELCKMLKTNVNTSHIPIIMLTAKAGTENKIEGLETGADDYLVKPFDVNELLARVKNLIEQRQNLRKLFARKEVDINPEKVTVTSIDQKFLEQLLTLLEANYFELDFGIVQMQESLNMSKTQLHRKLKALTDEAPGELLRNFRLKKAAQLILQKADTISQIAYMVGFNNLSYFTKCFKDLYGVPPSSYSTSSK